jgi:chromosome segregation ATPase
MNDERDEAAVLQKLRHELFASEKDRAEAHANLDNFVTTFNEIREALGDLSTSNGRHIPDTIRMLVRASDPGTFNLLSVQEKQIAELSQVITERDGQLAKLQERIKALEKKLAAIQPEVCKHPVLIHVQGQRIQCDSCGAQFRGGLSIIPDASGSP